MQFLLCVLFLNLLATASGNFVLFLHSFVMGKLNKSGEKKNIKYFSDFFSKKTKNVFSLSAKEVKGGTNFLQDEKDVSTTR